MAHLSPSAMLRKHGLSAKKSWGQNFLVDPSIHRRIADACHLGELDTVVEIGAGLGHLTRTLAATGAKVIAVERDRELAAVLRAELDDLDRVEIVEANAIALDLEPWAAAAGRPLVVAGNLPYHLSSQILVRLLEQRRHLTRFVLMLQKEVGDRIAAPPGSRTYGVLSVFSQLAAVVDVVAQVSPGAFHPRPKVHSVVLSFRPRAEPLAPVDDESRFRRVVHAAFGQRRKTIRNALLGNLRGSDLAGGTRGEAGLLLDGLLSRAQIDPRARPETLSPESFARLSNLLGEAGGA